MPRVGLLFGALFAVTACFTSGPATNVGFARVDDIRQLEGFWRNRGIGSMDPQRDEPVYLSDLIWAPGALPVMSATITTISVKAKDDRTLEVQGLDGDEVLIQTEFVLGRDFKLEGGRLVLERQFDYDLSGEALGLWAMTGRVELGIDQQGQGKLLSSSTAGGLLLGVVPIAMGERNNIRFVRLKQPDPPLGSLPYSIAGGDGSTCTKAIRVIANTIEGGQRAQHDWVADMMPGQVPFGVLTIGVKLAVDPVVQAEQAARLAPRTLATAKTRDEMKDAFTREGMMQGSFDAARVLNPAGSARYQNDALAVAQEARFQLLTIRWPGSDRRTQVCFDVTSYTRDCCADEPAYYQQLGCERLRLELAGAEDDATQLAKWVAVQKDQTTGSMLTRQMFALTFIDSPERYDPLIAARHRRAQRVRDAIAAASAAQNCPAHPTDS